LALLYAPAPLRALPYGFPLFAFVDTLLASGLYCLGRMVTVAQSAERQIVALEVAGSSPVGHPHSLTRCPEGQ
jgi:hypothetical protein